MANSIFFPEGSDAVWGSITGTLFNQTDLQTALDAKLSLSGGTLTGQLSIETTNLILRVGGTQNPTGSTGYAFPGEIKLLIINSDNNFCDIAASALSDGYAGASWNSTFIAQTGDVDPSTGSLTTAGSINNLGGWYGEMNDTTDATSLDMGWYISTRNDYVFLVNADGDIGIGRANSSFAGSPTPITTANLKIIGATADATFAGVVQAAGYKSSDGTTGATAGPFTTITSIQVKNGLVTTLTGS